MYMKEHHYFLAYNRYILCNIKLGFEHLYCFVLPTNHRDIHNIIASYVTLWSFRVTCVEPQFSQQRAGNTAGTMWRTERK